MALVKLPPLDTKPPQHFTAEQARRFLDAAQGDTLGPLYAMALGTGLRRGELLALGWKDIAADRGSLNVRQAKSRAGVRTVPIPAFAALALDAVPRRPGRIWPYRPEYVTRHFHRLTDQAGLPRMTFHSLRHTAATLMAEQGVSEEVRRWILGHSAVEMTRHYSHESAALMRDAVERLGRAVA